MLPERRPGIARGVRAQVHQYRHPVRWFVEMDLQPFCACSSGERAKEHAVAGIISRHVGLPVFDLDPEDPLKQVPDIFRLPDAGSPAMEIKLLGIFHGKSFFSDSLRLGIETVNDLEEGLNHV